MKGSNMLFQRDAIYLKLLHCRWCLDWDNWQKKKKTTCKEMKVQEEILECFYIGTVGIMLMENTTQEVGLTEEKLWAPQGSPLYLHERSMSSNWWLSLSINSRLVPSKFLGGRKSLKSDSFLNQARRSSWSKSRTMGLTVRLASSRPNQWPAKYKSLLVSL